MMAQKRTATVQQILTWLIEDRLFGIDIAHCREVDKDKEIVTVPHAKEQIAGIVNLRGDVVTVIDLRVLLGHDKRENDSGNVIIRLKSKTAHIAVKADAISDVINIAGGQIEGTPAHLSENEIRFISSVAMTEKGLAVILNPDEILKAV